MVSEADVPAQLPATATHWKQDDSVPSEKQDLRRKRAGVNRECLVGAS